MCLARCFAVVACSLFFCCCLPYWYGTSTGTVALGCSFFPSLCLAILLWCLVCFTGTAPVPVLVPDLVLALTPCVGSVLPVLAVDFVVPCGCVPFLGTGLVPSVF